MRLYLFITLALLFPLLALSQEGTPYVTNFRGVDEFDSQNWSICQDEQDVMLFANRQGLLTFDGTTWSQVRLHKTLLDIKRNPFDGKIYAGGDNDFGYLRRSPVGELEFVSLLPDSLSPGIITDVVFSDSIVVFAGEESVTRMLSTNYEIFQRWNARPGELFTGIIDNGRNFYINVAGKGLHRIDSDTLFPIVTGYMTENSEILFTLPYDDSKLLVGTSDSRLRLFDGIKYWDYNTGESDYLETNWLSDGILLNDSTYLFSTLFGGVVGVNRHTGDTKFRLNYQNGLPDDEIYSIGSDNNHGLWLAHGNGISRIDPGLPVKDFSGYPGIDGYLITAIKSGDRLYAGTSEGLYVLDEVRNYDNREVLYKLPEKKSQGKSTGEIITQSGEERKSLKKVLSRLFSRKKEEQKTVQPETSERVKTPAQPRYGSRTVRTLVSVEYLFRKIEGINSRVFQLETTNEGMFAVSSSGLYIIRDMKVRQVSQNLTISGIFPSDRPDTYFLATGGGISIIKKTNGAWTESGLMTDLGKPVFSVVCTPGGVIWTGEENGAGRYILEDDHLAPDKIFHFGSDYTEEYRAEMVNDNIWLFANDRIYKWSSQADSMIQVSIAGFTPSYSSRNSILLRQPGFPWIRIDGNLVCLDSTIVNRSHLENLIRLFPEPSSITWSKPGEYWVVDSESKIYLVDNTKQLSPDMEFNLFIRNIANEKGDLFEPGDLEFGPANRAVTLNLFAPYYLRETSTQYRYRIDELMSGWSKWSVSPDINLFLESGEYNIRFEARNILGRTSEEEQISLTIKPPFSRTIWFYLIVSVVFIFIFVMLVKFRERKLRHDKQVLERKVKERTVEIEQKKEQIEEQRDEIFRQKEEITDSITYASRIQSAILPVDKSLDKTLGEHFILYQPRDIVSGDFYWAARINKLSLFAVADCTGHGVPGAIMSMLGVSLLNEIAAGNVSELRTDLILNKLREKVISSLRQTGKDQEARDGMDIALIIRDGKKKQVEFSGAFNPLWVVRKGKLTEYKADRMPVGIDEQQLPFTRTEVKLKSGDMVYLFSDGYIDQFGGPNDKRFTSRALKQLLTGISSLPASEQESFLKHRFNEWKGSNEQVDDIVIAGIRIS